MVRIEMSQLSTLRNASTANIVEAAHRIVERSTKESTIFDADAESKVPHFDIDELVLGHVLGRGGFCAVRELNAIKIQTDVAPKQSKFNRVFFSCFRDDNLHPAALLGDDKEVYDGESVTEATSDVGGVPRESLARYVSKSKHKKNSSSSSQYVVKQVNSELQYSDKVAYLKAIVDIELEAKYMTSLHHPNILTVRGLCNPNPANGEKFLILDRLKETLGKKMQDWLRRHRQCRGITGAIVGSKRKKEDLLVERLVVAHNIADAVDYLHSHNMIYRDLKPDNIGFDYYGCLKLFDFGLAREVRPEDRVKGTDLYRLTGFTGAIRYMAPEVGLRRPYNTKADVYSWSQLMWYILQLEPPLGVYTPQMFKERVFKRGTRPAVMDGWPEHMPQLIKKCWSADIDERPNFGEIKESLSIIMLPYNTKKLLPNRFEEPQVPGQAQQQQPPQQKREVSVASSSVSDSVDAMPETCGLQSSPETTTTNITPSTTTLPTSNPTPQSCTA